jgi:hypothetical protein
MHLRQMEHDLPLSMRFTSTTPQSYERSWVAQLAIVLSLGSAKVRGTTTAPGAAACPIAARNRRRWPEGVSVRMVNRFLVCVQSDVMKHRVALNDLTFKPHAQNPEEATDIGLQSVSETIARA